MSETYPVSSFLEFPASYLFLSNLLSRACLKNTFCKHTLAVPAILSTLSVLYPESLSFARFYSIPVIIIYASLDYIYSLIGHDCICPSQVEIHLHKKVSIHSVRHLLYLLSPRGDTFPRRCLLL